MRKKDRALMKSLSRDLARLAVTLGLSQMEIEFALALVADPNRSQTVAARAAGAKDPAVQGCRWAARPRVRQFMDALLKAGEEAVASVAPVPPDMEATGRVALTSAMGAAEILLRLSEHARVDMADFFTLEPLVVDGKAMTRPDGSPVCEHRLDLWKALQAGKTHLIRELRWTQYGPAIKLHDAQAALNTLAKIRGLLDERPADDAAALWVRVLGALPPAALAEVHRAMLAAQPVDAEARVVPQGEADA